MRYTINGADGGVACDGLDLVVAVISKVNSSVKCVFDLCKKAVSVCESCFIFVWVFDAF
jgi:hypothetical protein